MKSMYFGSKLWPNCICRWFHVIIKCAFELSPTTIVRVRIQNEVLCTNLQNSIVVSFSLNIKRDKYYYPINHIIVCKQTFAYSLHIQILRIGIIIMFFTFMLRIIYHKHIRIRNSSIFNNRYRSSIRFEVDELSCIISSLVIWGWYMPISPLIYPFYSSSSFERWLSTDQFVIYSSHQFTGVKL